MNIEYDTKNDLLYLRFENEPSTLVNKRISDNIVLDIGPEDKIVGIEIMDASKNINLNKILPVSYQNTTLTLSP